MSKARVIRGQFPIFNSREPLVYLDNASTTQKPLEVIEAIRDYYFKGSANIHRGSYALARKAEDAVAEVRGEVQRFIHASDPEEVVFTSGTTEGLNLVAQTYGDSNVGEGDEVIVSVMEHHSNFLPWQRLCEAKRARLRVVSLTPSGHVDLDALKGMVNGCTKIIAVNYVSHVLGTVNPIAEICGLAHVHGAVVVVDAAQAVAHVSIDVGALDCDFIAFSGHKMYGPTGIGVLYGRKSLLDGMVPYKVGGGMVDGFSSGGRFRYDKVPYRFEAGTMHVAGIIGLGAAIRFITGIGYGWIAAYEGELFDYFKERFRALPFCWVGGIIPTMGMGTFYGEGMHALDVGLRLDAAGIAVRSGGLCAQPLMDYLGVGGGIRVSLGVYNMRGEIDHLIKVLGWVAAHVS